MAGRMDDAVHVQVEVVVLDAVRVGLARVGVHARVPDEFRHSFSSIHNGLGVSLHQPAVQPGNSHLMPSFSASEPESFLRGTSFGAWEALLRSYLNQNCQAWPKAEEAVCYLSSLGRLFSKSGGTDRGRSFWVLVINLWVVGSKAMTCAGTGVENK